jgi:CheY-like chemotaxis protein
MKVLISWSGHRSGAMAESLRGWLPCVIQACDPWVSSSDIDAGVKWGSTLAKELQQTQFGIICLTPGNLTAPWLLFEAGALSKFVDDADVCPYLLDIQPTDVTGPLAQFQSVKADKEGTWRLVKSINKSLGDQTRDENVIEKVFEVLWPDLETSIKGITKNPHKNVIRRRSQEDLLDEVLRTVRDQSRMLRFLKLNELSHPSDRFMHPILWVDDNPANNYHESRKLEQLGASIDFVCSTEKAKEIIGLKPFDLIISDISRIENGRNNENAGYELQDYLQEHNIEIPLIFYIGDINRANPSRTKKALGVTDTEEDLLNLVTWWGEHMAT